MLDLESHRLRDFASTESPQPGRLARIAGRFNPEDIALAIKSSVHEAGLSVRDALFLLQQRADFRLTNMPTRDELLAEAQAMFAKTISLDDVVDHAYDLLFESSCGSRESTTARARDSPCGFWEWRPECQHQAISFSLFRKKEVAAFWTRCKEPQANGSNCF